VSYGHLECCGVTAPITSMALKDGMFVIVAEGRGPAPAVSGPVTLYGEDGVQVIGIGPWLTCERIPRWHWHSFEWTLRLTVTYGYPDMPESRDTVRALPGPDDERTAVGLLRSEEEK